MGDRKKIGLLLLNSETWTGGYYYCLNLIKSAAVLPEREQPAFVVFYDNNRIVKDPEFPNYPYIRFLPAKKEPGRWEKILFSLKLRLGLHPEYLFYYPANTVSFIYPCTDIIEKSSLDKIAKIYWIPDFQYKYYPAFFSEQELAHRDKVATYISKRKNLLVVSSNAVLQDYRKFYPNAINEVKILNFASVLPVVEQISVPDITKKYGISQPYYISPNQFWIHKNHKVVLEAALILKKKGIDFLIVFTGKETDYRYPTYTQDLKAFVKSNALDQNIYFLGFVPREDQLVLMKNAICVVQPSLFEGWSTVVEDTKAINQYILLSDLPVHREQCTENVEFFLPSDALALANCLERHMLIEPALKPINYNKHIIDFAKKIIELY